MKKRIICILLAAIMIVSLLPTAAFAATWYDVYVDGIRVTSDNMTDVLGEADGDGATVTYTPAGTGTNAKLTLNGATIEKINYVGNDTLNIEVIGTNTVTPTETAFGIVTWTDNGYGDAANTNASLNICGDGTLTVNLTNVDGTNDKNGIFVNKNLTIKGVTLTVTTGDATNNNHGIHAEHDIIIDGATVNATAGTGVYSCGIRAKNAVEITGGTVTATAGTATAASVGILAPTAVTISGGTVTAKAGTTGAMKAAIAATANGVEFGTLTVGSAGKPATLGNAATANKTPISESSGGITGGALVQATTTDPVIISFPPIQVSTKAELKNAIDNAPVGTETVIKLGSDITLSDTLTIPAGKEITLDLNGKKLDRGLSGESPAAGGNVITVNGNLTINDSSSPSTGKITGGNNTEFIGGVRVSAGGELTLNGGSICNNKTASSTGGVFVYSGAKFTMNGGSICGNTAGTGSSAGGVTNQGTFIMTGGSITGNSAKEAGGVKNTAAMTVGGSARIINNTVYTGGIAPNLETKGELTLSDLTEGAKIGVFTVDSDGTWAYVTHPVAFAKGTNDELKYFTSDREDVSIYYENNKLMQGGADSFFALQAVLDSAEDNSTVTLSRSFKAVSSDFTKLAQHGLNSLTVSGDKKITLDLNGYELDASELGRVLTVKGKASLTVKDSSDPSTGKITGGKANGNDGEFEKINGGAIYIAPGSQLELQSGTICDNEAKSCGGAVYVQESAAFTMSGGTISGNDAGEGGGAVYVRGTLIQSAGEISGNSAERGAGVYVYYASDETPGTFTMNDGTISANTASDKGGGVYVDNKANVTIYGEITGNSAAALGGGVCCNTAVTVGGTVVVKNNTVNKAANNIYLRNISKASYSPVITISSTTALESGAEIGVTLESGAGVFAENVEYDASSYFFLDIDSSNPVYKDKKLLSRFSSVSTEQELLGAIAKAESNVTTYIILNGSIDLTAPITILPNKDLNLDLNGNTVTEKYSVPSNPSMINVQEGGKLTITDKSASHDGKITGGNSGFGYGGTIWNCGTVILENGVISDSKAATAGGAIYNNGENARFIMTGGKITNCTAASFGGAVFNFCGEMEISGGIIENCTTTKQNNPEHSLADAGLGGAIWSNNSLTISGGTIRNCHSAYAAGAVFSDGNAATQGKGQDTLFTMTGGEIVNCTSERSDNESVYIRNSTMTMSGGRISGKIFRRDSTEGVGPACVMKFTGGLFTVDVSDYTDKGYVCQKNTNAATKEAYPYTVVPEMIPSSDGGGSSAIQVSNPQNGTVIINKKNAAPGSTVTVIAKPDDGYEIDTVSIVDKNGKKVEVKELGDGRYSFTMPEEDVSISVTFKPVVEEKHENDFADVKSGDYYYEAVLWAAENGVTKGTDNTHFAPDKPTTRAQVVTFLWRAAGSPEPTGTENGFTDLVTGAYYEKAVAWAVEKGITKGTGATAFSPEAVCTRGQIVTFLARFAGVSDTDTESVFSDVNASDFFAAAVRWAKDNGVTDGISKEKFGPELTCTRAQVVTFLYRWMVR